MNHRISIITTNFNGATYLEKAMRSVLDQGYPDLEYIVIDGGSTDGSQRIIERYERHLTYWESERLTPIFGRGSSTTAELYGVNAAIGGFRVRSDSKSGLDFASYLEEMMAALLRSTESTLPRATPQSIRANRLGCRYKLAGRLVAKLGGSRFIRTSRFFGKTVHWDYSANMFVARNSAVIL